MTVAATPIKTRSTAKEMFPFTTRKLPDPATNTTAVWISVYREFIPRRQGVTIVLLITDWNTMEAPPIAAAVTSIAISFGILIFIA